MLKILKYGLYSSVATGIFFAICLLIVFLQDWFSSYLSHFNFSGDIKDELIVVLGVCLFAGFMGLVIGLIAYFRSEKD